MSKLLFSAPDLYFLTTAAELIGDQVGLDHVQRERLVINMREAVRKGALGAYHYSDGEPLRKNVIGELVRKIGVDEFGDDEHCTVEPSTAALCVRPGGVNAWLKTTSWGFTWDVQGPTTTSGQIVPIQRQQAQEDIILNCLKCMKIDPLNFPKNQDGKKGFKAAVRMKLQGNPLFVGATIFDKAWERMLKNGSIVIKQVSP
jgi:hypothetical protein